MKERITLDVRQIPPPQRHPLIFKTFDHLDEADFFELVNDHDPLPLKRSMTERSPLVEWEYLEQGPEQWRVKITKKKFSGENSGCCGTCS